jgi:hypothetical protein
MAITFCDTAYSNAVLIHTYEYPDNVITADCYVEPEAEEWRIKQSFISNETNICTYVSPVAGDLDGDGIPEILVAKFLRDNGDARIYDGIYIYWGDNRQTPTLVNIMEGYFESHGFSIVRVKIGGVYKSIILTEGYYDGYLYAYDPDPSKTTEATSRIWQSSHQLNGYGVRWTYSIGVVDFDSDGEVEVYAGNQIFDASTGTMLVNGGSATNKGFSNVFPSYHFHTSFAADVTDDGKPEYLAGTEAYSVNIVSRTDYTQNSLTLVASIPDIPITGSLSLKDGATMVADVNMDGRLDVIVSAALNTTTYGLAAWDVQTESLIAKCSGTTTGNRYSMPFIGNIDNEPNLEILVVSTNKLRGYRWDGNQTFSQIYDYIVVDGSGATGITLFDFNQDNIMELVYRDETHLRILQANAPSFSNVQTFSATSGTATEHAIVVDVDNDGQAEIVTTGGTSTYAVQGTLRIFEAGDGTKWAPARKVWNQYMYNSVNVNEDLTIPAYPLNPATVFPGGDGIIGTSDDIRPYNNFLQQQTALNVTGTTLWLTPDAELLSPAQTYYYADGDSLVITVELSNIGDAGLQTPLYIAAYRDEILTSNRIAVDSLMLPVNATETETLTLTIRNFSAIGAITELILSVNDKGGAEYVQAECKYDNNTVSLPFYELLMAHDDKGTTINTVPISISLLDNDSIPITCPQKQVFIIGENTANGTHTLNTDMDTLVYVPAPTFTGIDTVTYILVCGNDTSRANIYVMVIEPFAAKYIACEHAVVGVGFKPVAVPAGIMYYWKDAGGNLLNGGAATNTLSVTKNANNEQIVYVEPRFSAITFPLYPVVLELGDCGVTNPAGCALTGTVLYKEDFGGNSPADPPVKPDGISQVVGYTYNNSTTPVNGEYGICKVSHHYSDWYDMDDHTYPNNTTRGYLLQVNASEMPGQFYQAQIDNLCPGTQLYFSYWLMSIVNFAALDKTNQIILIDDIHGNILAQYYTGDIPEPDPTWRQYGFKFPVPDGQTSIRMRIINNGKGSSGNDFVMDDIEVRVCLPPVSLTTTTDTTLCAGSSLRLEGGYTDDGTLGNSYLYRWEKNTGDINDPDDWAEIPGTLSTAMGATISSYYDITNASLSDIGSYRLVVAGTAAGMSDYNCRSMSDIITVRVNSVAGATTVISADTSICYNSLAELTASASGVTNATFKWYASQTSTAALHSGASFTTPLLTATTKYYVSVSGLNFCENVANDRKEVTVHVYDSLQGGILGDAYRQVTCFTTETPTISWGHVPIGGAGGYHYEWFMSTDAVTFVSVPAFLDVQQITISASPSATTYYYRKVTDSLCGVAYSDTITIHPAPAVSTDTMELCVGLRLQLTPYTGGVWTSGDESKASVTDNWVTGISAGFVTLTFKDAVTNCEATMTVHVKDFPDVSDIITGKKVLCQGETIELSNAFVGGKWRANNSNITLSDNEANPVMVTGVTVGTTYVSYTVSKGICETTTTISLRVIDGSRVPEIIIGFEK